MKPEELGLIINIGIGAVATVLALALWPRTRDPAWMLIILGTVVHYGSLVFQSLEIFGVATLAVSDPWLSTIIRALLTNGSFIFFAIAFVITIRRRDHW